MLRYRAPMSRALLLIAVLALALSVACDEPPAATSTPNEPAVTVTPTMAAPTTTGSPTPTRTPGTIPTGIDGVDGVIDAITSGDVDAVLQLVRFIEVECSDAGYGPRCDSLGLPAGTMVSGLSMGGCDIGVVPERFVRDGLVRYLDRDEPLQVWSIYEQPDDGGLRLLFTTASAATEHGPVLVTGVRDGSITMVATAACADRLPPEHEVGRWIVHPSDLGHPLNDPEAE